MNAASVNDWRVDAPAGAPEDVLAVAPPSIEAIAAVLEWASREGRPVLPWGGGTHMGPSCGDAPELLVLTSELTRVVDWQPGDLTLVVEAGALVADIEAMLGERSQTMVLAEDDTGSTIGGMIAAGISGYRRLRYGPSRDRMHEAVVASGDGRVFTAGGRDVKNVTGYDIPRLVCGSHGSLGVIGQVCLKLWPVPESSATIAVDVADFGQLYRPLALLETEAGPLAYLAGTAEEVAGQAEAVGAVVQPGLGWPPPLSSEVQIELRVPAPLVRAAVEQVCVAGSDSFRAQHGVGVVAAGFPDWSDERLATLRSWAEANAGSAVVIAAAHAEVDRWGTPPMSAELQRRVKQAFDPRRVMVPGRLPGGV